jgi:hypothetical protein
MPSGSGKTLVGLGVLEALTGLTEGVALVVVPRKAFLDQTLSFYRDHSNTFFDNGEGNVLIVASDFSDASVKRTTDANEIANFVSQKGPRLLLSLDALLKITILELRQTV